MRTFLLIELLLFIMLAVGFLFAQEQKVLITFSEPMDKTGLLDINNWKVFDEQLQEIPIQRIGVAGNDSLAVLFLPFLSYKTNFIVRVANVTDKAGNLINDKNSGWFYCDGFDQRETRPYLILK